MGKELKGLSSMVRSTTFLYGSEGGESSKDMGLTWRGGTDNNFALKVTLCRILCDHRQRVKVKGKGGKGEDSEGRGKEKEESYEEME